MQPLYRQTIIIALAFITLFSACSKHTAAPPFAINSINPIQGSDSTQVTINGTGFSAATGDDIVSFNGKAATVLSASSTSLVVRTPTLAGTGNIKVTVEGKTLTAGIYTYDTTWLATTVSDVIPFPRYLSLDNSGNLYVASFGNGEIYKITPGAISTYASIPAPNGMTIDSDGNLYVAANGEAIYKVSPAQAETILAQDVGVNGGLAVDNNGNIYAANESNGTIDIITFQGVGGIGTVSTYDSSVGTPSGLALSRDGKLYVLASYHGGYTGSSAGILFSMTQPNVTAPFASGFDYDGNGQIAFDSDNNLYVPVWDQGRSQGFLMRVRPDGTITNLAMPNIPFITGLACGKNGTFYVTGLQNSQSSITGLIIKLSMH